MNEKTQPPAPATTLPETSALAWRTGRGEWRLDFERPLIMSILNLTPDSFSDGGQYPDTPAALAAALSEEAEGADILDLGAESTRPGSAPVSADEEWARLEPLLTALSPRTGRPISVDTYRAEVAERAIEAGAAIINDIYAGRKDPRILELAARRRVPIILMHMQGEPRNMQLDPHYDDVVSEVHDFLLERARAAEAAGLPREMIWLDPGLGFGKNQGHNLSIIRHYDRVMPRGYRRVMALSRKAFLGRIMDGAPPRARDGLTAVANALAVMKGAEILRVHRAAPSRAAAALARAVLRAV
ncbi:MAG: dihydropteroate synthase [Candidatus Adiutrix sp.]|jgi:dihydropteroate synthase|nr:dihydropteroate synthase [Candidatus Adiutrix sp.]